MRPMQERAIEGTTNDGTYFGKIKKTKSGRKVVRVQLPNGLWITKVLSPYAK